MDWLQIWILLLIAFFIISKTKISKTTKPCTITTTNMTNQEFTDATRNDSFDGFNKSQHTTRRKLPSNRDYSPIVRKLDKTSHSNYTDNRHLIPYKLIGHVKGQNTYPLYGARVGKKYKYFINFGNRQFPLTHNGDIKTGDIINIKNIDYTVL